MIEQAPFPFSFPGFAPHPPVGLLTLEILYFIIGITLCIITFLKTKEVYNLTKHKGIFYFRQTFIFFILAYIMRSVFLAMLMINPSSASMIFMPLHDIALFLLIYFSFMALFSLTYGTLWQPNKEHYAEDNLLNGIAVALSCLVFFGRYEVIPIGLGLCLLVYSIIKIYLTKVTRKIFFTQMNVLYILLFIFWICNLVLFLQEIDFGIKIGFYAVSLVLFGIITHRVFKRLK